MEESTRSTRKPKEEPKVPTLGRIVMYVTGSGTIRPAIITKVWDFDDEQTVDLTVFNSEGSVPLVGVALGSDETDIGTWHWPSY